MLFSHLNALNHQQVKGGVRKIKQYFYSQSSGNLLYTSKNKQMQYNIHSVFIKNVYDQYNRLKHVNKNQSHNGKVS